MPRSVSFRVSLKTSDEHPNPFICGIPRGGGGGGPCLMATSVIQSLALLLQPLFLAWQNVHTFSYKKPSLMPSANNTANPHTLKSQTVEYFITSPC